MAIQPWLIELYCLLWLGIFSGGELSGRLGRVLGGWGWAGKDGNGVGDCIGDTVVGVGYCKGLYGISVAILEV